VDLVESSPRQPWTRALRAEILLVLGVSLGASAAYSVVSLIAKLTAPAPLSQQTTALNPSQAPGRPWLDLTYQLMGIFFDVVPALLALYLLGRVVTAARSATAGAAAAVTVEVAHDVRGELGLDSRRGHRRPWFDLGTGLGLAAVIGVPGLGLYLAARALGLNTTVAPANLPHVWWAVPVLLLAAVANAVLEEVVVVGYLMTRLGDLGWRVVSAVAASALLRGSYHLYQGFGAFVGNAAMGVVFALFFVRTRRLFPLVIAHALIDAVVFIGYLVLHGKLGFLT
jgi:membrane protease YdiL (CAAX protease family)